MRGVSAGWCEGVATVEAAHDGYRHLPGRPRHHRRWSLSSDELRIDDTVTGQGRHRIIVRWHLAPGAEARLASGGAVIIAGGHEIGVTARSELPSASPLAVETAEASVGFGKTIQVPVLTYACHAELPVRISTTWRRARHCRGAHETGSPAAARGSGNPARRAVPGARPHRGAGSHDLVGDLARHRARRHRAGPGQPAGQGAARPDLVRQAVRKARSEGLAATHQAVAGRLAQDVPLGYSAAGIALQVGTAVTGIRPGQLVATGGAGKANHAEYQVVPGLLCAVVPDKVSPQDAAFTTIAAIALHGLRLAAAGPARRSSSSA